MEITELCKVLSSKTGMRVMKLLGSRSLSSIELFKEYSRIYSDIKNRETIYYALERLVKIGILTKAYDRDSKKIIYRILHRKILLDLTNDEVFFED